MSEHIWVQQNLDAYVAGGLPTDDCQRVEQHVAACADCTHALTQARQLETTMAELFVDARPDAKLEERMIRSLRKVSVPMRWPAWTRFAIGAAAVVMLGVVGALVQAVAGGTVFKGADRVLVARTQSTNNVKQIALPIQFRGRTDEEGREGFSTVDIDPAAREFDTDISFKFKNSRIDVVSVPGSVNPNEAVGIMDGDKKAPPVNLPATRGFGFGFDGQGGALETKEKTFDMEKYVKANTPTYGEGKPLDATFYGRSGATGENAVRTGGGGGQAVDSSKPSFKKTVGKNLNMISGLTANGTLTPELGDALAINTERLANEKSHLKRVQEANLGDGYFKPGDGAVFTPPPIAKASAPKPGTNPPLPVRTDELPAVQPKQGEPPPVDPGLKIIRTGEMEFEVDSFDNAVKAVMNLLKPLQAKGAFELKRDSVKQANGKTRGHVVVRMKPEHLDDFVLDLRRELGKMGDLRLQQIGSQDVTRQFIDTDSELKAAKLVAERLIEIIKTPKAEVKDLIAAEKELGVWRTKIEKMEGELRYYANQVALSTLTITLVEKEIAAASALVVSGNVKMRIEVDNVSRARETVEKAVEELQGRIVKSDEKQHPAGQVEAIVHVEIKPASKDAFRKTLDKLGIISAHEDTQSQTTEGGTGPVLSPKRRVNDVRFELSLYNIVNIKPKHALKLDVVSAEVRANFEKLKDEIVRVHKGQIRDARLDENQDKQKVIAVIDFSVPTEKKPAIDKLIATFGPTLDRVNSQAALTDVSTEQKFGYTLTLYSIANVEPREKVRLHVEVKDMEKRLGEVADAVKDSGGAMAKPKSGLNKQGQTEALLVITVPLKFSDRLVKQIKETGKVIDWVQAPNTAVPDNDLATSQVVVLLTGPNPIIPDDEGLSNYASRSLYLSFTVFSTCVLLIFTGLSFILPWAVVIGVSVWAYRRFRPSKPPTTRAAVVSAAPTAPEPPKP